TSFAARGLDCARAGRVAGAAGRSGGEGRVAGAAGRSGARRYERWRTPTARSAVRAPTAATPLSLSGALARRRANAEPTMTPSAKAAPSAAWARLLTPRPTATGRPVCSRVRVTSWLALELTASLVPVMPMRLAA